MKTSQAGLDLITYYEGESDLAYQDGIGVWTIGVGHTNNVHPGDTCTKGQAQAWLAEDIAEAEAGVNRLVRVPISQPMFDALVSFTFNLGCGNLQQSSLLRFVNSTHNMEAANEFAKWNHAGGKVELGLTRRRNAERLLFLSGVVG